MYDAILLVSFGGPEGPDDVIPFLENVLRGKNVPRERMLAVAEHYQHFGGRSPINDQNRALIAALEAELAARGPQLPVYWGNRNWHPMLADTLRRMRDDGVRRALAFFTSAYSSYSGCRQYRENIAAAREAVGAGAPEVDKLRVYYNHPGFIGPNVEHVRAALDRIPAERRDAAALLFTAHSIPLSMANTSNYVRQLEEASKAVAEGAGHPAHRLVYQSRSGSPRDPWLEPDVVDALKELRDAGARDVVASPLGFISDHMEVMYDLDTEAAEAAAEMGLNFVRAATVGTHPAFVAMIRDLVVERMAQPLHQVCAENCCPRPEMPARPPLTGAPR